MPYQCPFLDTHLTTHHLNIGDFGSVERYLFLLKEPMKKKYNNNRRYELLFATSSRNHNYSTFAI